MFRYGFDKHLRQLGVADKDGILAAVSGGMDSMCMLDALANSSLDLKVTVAHVNFNLRGQESDGDTAMVESWCKEHRVELLRQDFDTREYARQSGQSIEMAARELRYAWFYRLMGTGSYRFLSIAHNADDNAETLLLNLTRGTGIEGICGIREKLLIGSLPMEGNWTDLFIIRPLLPYTRKQIERYAAKFKVPNRTDSTNLESDYSRNRIRNEVFPQLARINPSVIQTFNSDIRHFQQAVNILGGITDRKCRRLACRFTTFRKLEKSKYATAMCGLNLAMNKRAKGKSYICCIVELEKLLAEQEWEFWLYYILREYDFSTAVINDICASIREEEGPKKFLSGLDPFTGVMKAFEAVKERGLLKIYDNRLEPATLTLDTRVAGKDSWRTRKESSSVCPTLYMDAACVKQPVTCRPVKAGDRFSPLGLHGSKKLSDYLTDIKFENIHKGNVTVMEDSTGKIIAIPGLQIDDSVKITSASEQIFQVTVL